MQPHTPVETADLAWALAGVCRLLHVPFDVRLFLQQNPPPASVATVSRAAERLGLEAVRLSMDAHDARGRTMLAFRRGDDGAARIALVLREPDETMVVSERDRAVERLSQTDFAARFDCQMFGFSRKRLDPDAELAAPPFGLRWFIPELIRHRTVWRDVLVASLVMQLIGLLTPLLTQVVIDKVVVNHAQSTLIAVVAALAIFLVFNALLSYVRQYLLLHTGNRIDAVLGTRVFEHLLRLPPRYFERRPTGTLVARLQGIDTIREFITGATASVALDLPFALLFLAIMLWYSVPLTLIAVAAIAALTVLSLAVTPILRQRINVQFLAGARKQAFLTEYVSAMDTVKALQLEPQLAARYGGNLAEVLAAGFATRHLANVYSVAASALEQALAVAVLAAGAWLVMTTEGFTIGMLVAFQMFAARLAQPALRLAGLWQEFQQASIAVQRLGDLMDAPAEAAGCRTARMQSGPAKVEIENLSFRYAPEDPPLFENFALQVAPGACVALTGASGSGKSTLGRLLLGFYFPTSGAIRIDGHDTRHLTSNELRLQFGVVPQETRLFSGTIYENLLLAQPYASFAEAIEACKLAEIHDFIDQLPKGYETPIGEHGNGLSGGQKQRIAIARALLRRPRILLCDEATASLDHATAEALGHTINRLRGRVTIVFIAHQLPQSLGVDVVARLEARSGRRITRAAQTSDAITA